MKFHSTRTFECCVQAGLLAVAMLTVLVPTGCGKRILDAARISPAGNKQRCGILGASRE
jgi:hypothetical protein